MPSTARRNTFLLAEPGLVAERYRHRETGRASTLRHWVTPGGNHAVEGGAVGADRTFRDVAAARAYWRVLRALMAAGGYERVR